jgi:hypothetical protein
MKSSFQKNRNWSVTEICEANIIVDITSGWRLRLIA